MSFRKPCIASRNGLWKVQPGSVPTQPYGLGFWREPWSIPCKTPFRLDSLMSDCHAVILFISASRFLIIDIF